MFTSPVWLHVSRACHVESETTKGWPLNQHSSLRAPILQRLHPEAREHRSKCRPRPKKLELSSLRHRRPACRRILGADEFTRGRDFEGECACYGAKGVEKRVAGISVHLYYADIIGDRGFMKWEYHERNRRHVWVQSILFFFYMITESVPSISFMNEQEAHNLRLYMVVDHPLLLDSMDI